MIRKFIKIIWGWAETQLQSLIALYQKEREKALREKPSGPMVFDQLYVALYDWDGIRFLVENGVAPNDINGYNEKLEELIKLKARLDAAKYLYQF